jgi:hypothetical protein
MHLLLLSFHQYNFHLRLSILGNVRKIAKIFTTKKLQGQQYLKYNIYLDKIYCNAFLYAPVT